MVMTGSRIPSCSRSTCSLRAPSPAVVVATPPLAARSVGWSAADCAAAAGSSPPPPGSLQLHTGAATHIRSAEKYRTPGTAAEKLSPPAGFNPQTQPPFLPLPPPPPPPFPLPPRPPPTPPPPFL